MRLQATPHKLHLFFCTNTRENGDKSCGDTPATRVLADLLKARFKEAKLPIRITRTSCLGPCAQGPNIMCYPQEVWFQDVREEDVDEIEAQVKRILASATAGKSGTAG
ncbi:MAG: (2Fe-2S) ferredoxin domain-containing protein [Fibrobacteres bacterium]|jgi:(2Fe-2S) ferredoxin|nr:(2Fe-2S) ferredoxin domain-containing protein [Fibrobacterota bacterium]